MAAESLNVPYAMLGLFDADRIWLKARYGMSCTELHLEPEFSASVLAEHRSHCIENITGNQRAPASHQLTGELQHVRFYAGAPLKTKSGIVIGVLAVMDTAPRSCSHAERRSLERLADIAQALCVERIQAVSGRELRQAFGTLQKRANEQAQIITAMPQVSFRTTPEGTITGWNPAAEDFFGYSLEKIRGLHVSELNMPDISRIYRRLLNRVTSGEAYGPVEARCVNALGVQTEILLSAAPVLDREGQLASVAWFVQDVSESYRLSAIVWEEKERTETAFQLVDDAVIMADVEGRVIYLNPIAEHLVGGTIADTHGLLVEDIITFVHEESREPVELPLVRCLRESSPIEPGNHNMVLTADGAAIPVEDAAAPIRNREGSVCGGVMILRPVGRSVRNTGSNVYVSGIDSITGLLNRREFEHRFQQAMVGTAREQTNHALLILEISQFDDFINLHGRVAANELVRQASVLLRTQVRDIDIVARLQDHLFAILLTHCPLDQGRRIAEQMRRTLSTFPFYWEHSLHRVEVQIGLVPVTADSGSIDRTLQIAELVCQIADIDGLDSVYVLDVDDINGSLLSNRSNRSQTVDRAFENDRFQLYGQSIHPLQPELAAEPQMELLAHMLDDADVVIPPAAFLPVVKRTTRMAALDRRVVQRAFRMLQQAKSRSAKSWTINLSLESLTDASFPAYVKAQHTIFNISPNTICFEIDEADAISQLGETRRLTEALRPLGYTFCLSHFGAGPNSFSYLRNFDVDYLKIDGILSRNLATDPVDRAVMESIVNVARALGIRTIAHRIEDDSVIAILRQLGIDYVQGYAISYPQPLTTARQFD